MTGDINMGGKDIVDVGNLTADYFIGNGSQLTGLDLDTYVPYTGATGNVDLGAYDLIQDNKRFSNVADRTNPEEMIAYWPMDDNVLDVYGNHDGSWDGVADGGVLALNDGARFGGDSNIEVSNVADLYLTGGNGFSIEFWVKNEGFVNGTLLNKGSYKLEWIVGEIPTFGYIKATVGGSKVTSGDLSINTKYQVVLTFNKATETLSLYINSVLADSTSLTSVTPSEDDLEMGEDFVGLIDEVAMYNKPLSIFQILSHYHKIVDSQERYNYLSNYWIRDDDVYSFYGNISVNGIDLGTNTIADADVGNWNTAYGWGDHASAGYWKNDGTATATGDWDIGGYDFSATDGDFSGDLIVSNQALIGGVTSTVSVVDLGTGLASQWKMNDDLATTNVVDSVGTNDGTLNGGDNTEDISVAGKINEALIFNGSTDYINIGNPADLQLTEDFTLCSWIKSTNTNNQRIISKDNGITQRSYADFLTRNGRYGSVVWIGGAAKVLTTTDSIINDGEWHCVITTIDTTNGIMKAYVDGVLDSNTLSITGTVDNDIVGLDIGRRQDGTQYFLGDIDEVRIYDLVFDQSKVNGFCNEGNGTESTSSVFEMGLIHQVVATTETYTSSHGLDSLKDLAIEGDLEVNEDVYVDGSFTGGGDADFAGDLTALTGTFGSSTPTDYEAAAGERLSIVGDNEKFMMGAGRDSSIYYSGVNMIINPNEVGSGHGWLQNIWHVVSDFFVGGDLEVTGNTTIGGDLNVTGFMNGQNYVTQYHRNATIDTTSADTWINVTWDLTIDEETTSGYSLTDSNASIIIENAGIYRIQGCLHPKNNGVGNQEASLYSRILINEVEAKCLQFANSKEFKTTGIDTMPFIGTIYAEAGQKVQLQYYVTSLNIDFEGDAVFDDGVAGSINFERISK